MAVHRCPKCGFTYDLGEASVAGRVIGEGIADVVALLRRHDVVDLRTRRQPSVWSPLGYAAQMFSNVLDRLDTSDWTRSVVYHYPEPCERSLQWVAVHTVHEVHHHLLDIRRQMA